MKIEIFIATVAVGLGATLVMDLWGVFLKLAFRLPPPNYCLIGRWLCHMTNGVFKHADITAAERKPAECAIGWIAHYLIGVLFALALVALITPRWLQSPLLLPALIFGMVTVVFPFFIMHPAFGLGLAAARTPKPMQARLRSFMNHTVFGAGLYVSALVISSFVTLSTTETIETEGKDAAFYEKLFREKLESLTHDGKTVHFRFQKTSPPFRTESGFTRDFSLEEGSGFNTPDSHGYVRYQVKVVGPDGITLQYESMFDHRSFGPDEITIDRGTFRLPYK